jgi:two-component sensor histidine kinase
MLIPEDRADEESDIIERLRRGERLAHYETIRQRRDGTPVEVSMSVSPIKNRAGGVVGASNISRDITARRRAEEQQLLLLREMNHRIKNLFTLASSILALSARSAAAPSDLVKSVSERLGALARAQDLTIPQISETGDRTARQATLETLIETIVAPYQGDHLQQNRIQVHCCDFALKGDAVTGFALLINEFATNSAKYGALSAPDGHVEIHCAEHNDRFFVKWTETGGPRVTVPTAADGFGSRLVKATVEGQLRGEITREWRPEGLVVQLAIPAGQIRAA